MPGSGYSLAETVPGGWDQTAATCDDGSPVSNINVAAGRDRHLHLHEPQARADHRGARRRARRRAGLLVHGRWRPLAGELLSSTTTSNPALSNTRTFNDVPVGAGYSVAETVPAGWDLASATCDDGSSVSNIDVSRRRDGDLHVHEPQARPGRGRQGRHARRPAGLLVHGRRRPLAHRASRSTTTRTPRSRTPARSPTCPPGNGYSLGETVPSGWDQTSRHLRRRQPGVEHRRRPGRDRHLHLREPQARQHRGREGRAAQRRPGLRVHGRRRPLPGQLLPRRRRRTARCRTRARSRTWRPAAATRSRRPCRAAGTRRAPRATTAAPSRTSP